MTIGEEEDVERKKFWGRGKGTYVELPGVMQASLQFGQERVRTPTRKVLTVQLLSSMVIRFRFGARPVLKRGHGYSMAADEFY